MFHAHELAKLNSTTLTTNDLEFYAEEQLIEILPKFAANKLCLITEEYGPFSPNVPLRVPIWLAITLKKQKKCRIIVPEWMSVENLSNSKQAEKNSQLDELQVMPFHFMEISTIILEYASDDIANVEKIRSLLEDIENLRSNKIRQGLQAIGQRQVVEPLHCIQLKNFAAMELHSVRAISKSILGEFNHTYQEQTELYKSRVKLQVPSVTKQRNTPGSIRVSQTATSTMTASQDGSEPGKRTLRRLRR